MPRIATLKFFVGVEASATWHPGLSQWRPSFVDSQRLIARSQNWTKCVEYVWLSYPTWPSRWVLCISMQRLRLKGCHVACHEWMSGEICSHMWVTGSVMWAAVNDESLKFGVQGVTTTNWFPWARTEINFDTLERLFAPTFEIKEQKWPSQELFLKPQSRYLVGLGSKTLLLDSIT